MDSSGNKLNIIGKQDIQKLIETFQTTSHCLLVYLVCSSYIQLYGSWINNKGKLKMVGGMTTMPQRRQHRMQYITNVWNAGSDIGHF